MKVPMIECQYLENSMSLGQDHDRCIREADFKVSIALEDPSS